MKVVFRLVALLACMFWAMSSPAQDIPTPYVPDFTSAPAIMTQFEFDVTDSIFADTLAMHQIIYRDQPETSWSSSQAGFVYHICSTFTFSGQINYIPTSDILEWYWRSENDTAVVSQSPKNGGDDFPAPDYLIADMGADPAGDAENASGSYLDITHLYASYSDTKLYFRLENNGGGFPTSQGLFTYFIYSVGILDPNTTDSVAYALVYANVPGLFSPGLYVMDAVDSSFSQIASITTSISGNMLNMSCNISDLTSQPAWSDWPPPAGFIGIAPVTATAVFTDLSINDFGKSGVFVPKSNLLDFSLENNSPQISDPVVSLLGEDTIIAEISYTDPDSHLPTVRNFVFEGIEYPMLACVKSYETGALFEQSTTVTETGWYDYYFQFSDGLDTVVTPLDSIYVEIITYICGDASGDETVNVSDAVYLINYIFLGTAAPDPLESGDVNCDGTINVSDSVWIINFVFLGSNQPCDVDGDDIPDC
ncbi:MAG: hypothetical protein GWO41_04430 [candidate division Zixibacteria bacterium]|nr:hypothetical protein [candidate division Zixibacteria bacterium]NIR65509.1 hypothetical protein [candidate division Zixibacteria bacterium]NIS15481.1 hypothetical protein [candidate division Zixibacteria bacterium]NIS47195.1 hypothetical protein [candidate division Zixibacteria bacterium]NIT52000.1 hypothetical protein [candidate division Zixibacteria bacterium]